MAGYIDTGNVIKDVKKRMEGDCGCGERKVKTADPKRNKIENRLHKIEGRKTTMAVAKKKPAVKAKAAPKKKAKAVAKKKPVKKAAPKKAVAKKKPVKKAAVKKTAAKAVKKAPAKK